MHKHSCPICHPLEAATPHNDILQKELADLQLTLGFGLDSARFYQWLGQNDALQARAVQRLVALASSRTPGPFYLAPLLAKKSA